MFVPAPHAQVSPQILLVRKLGEGGMGSVWIAEHRGLQTQVAVKFLNLDLARHPGILERFSREAAAAANVKSPHVVQVFDHGFVEGVPFIVMELLDGQDLASRISNGRAVPPPELTRIVDQIGKALGRAHERGIVHRDIKPENVFLCDEGVGEVFVKLLDFGIAKVASSTMAATRTGMALGTPYYMSPEQAIGSKTVDHRTDFWSLGVLVFQCLTGRRPFDGETDGALTLAIHHGPIPIPSEYSPALPPAVDAWFLKACARNPNDRFASAKELAEQFSAAWAGAPGESRPPLQPTIPLVGYGGLHAPPEKRLAAPSASLPPTVVTPSRLSGGNWKLLLGSGIVASAALAIGWSYSQSRPDQVALRSAPTLPSGPAPVEPPSPAARLSEPEREREPPPVSIDDLPKIVEASKPAIPREVPSVRPTTPEDETPSSNGGRLDAQQIQSTVSRYVGSVKRRCWQPALDSRDKDAPVSAKVTVTITVSGSGEVEATTSSGDAVGYPGLAYCLRNSVKTWLFPAAGGTTIVNVPFIFSGQ